MVALKLIPVFLNILFSNLNFVTIELVKTRFSINPTLLISIGKLKPTIGTITYRNTCALDSNGKIAYKLILKLLPVIFLGKCSSNSNYFGL